MMKNNSKKTAADKPECKEQNPVNISSELHHFILKNEMQNKALKKIIESMNFRRIK
mgnify:CR=1 FL=1